MSSRPDPFRDFGILPENASPPVGVIRASFSTGTVIGQYIATGILSFFGLAIAVVFAFTLPLPFNLLAPVLTLAVVGWLVYIGTRNDYRWIELDGDIIRAKHLYTGRIVERRVEEIDDLLTLVIQLRTLAVKLTEMWLGRIRGVDIRFRDGRTPFRVSRSDPAMKNAQELIQALIYRMSQTGAIDAEVIDLRGAPLVRRIFWKEPPA